MLFTQWNNRNLRNSILSKSTLILCFSQACSHDSSQIIDDSGIKPSLNDSPSVPNTNDDSSSSESQSSDSGDSHDNNGENDDSHDSDDDDNGENDDSDDSDDSDDNDDNDDNDDSDDSDDNDDSDDSDDSDDPVFDLGTLPDFTPPPSTGNCDIDFLFVVDSSSSMQDEQEALASSVPEFISTITTEIQNLSTYHVGVISTDESWANSHQPGQGCAQRGGLIIKSGLGVNTDCGPYADGKNFMTANDDLNVAFPCAAKLGVMGSGDERPMQSLGQAISPAMTEPGACNEDFFRDDAVLVLVMITDEEDDRETHPENPGEIFGSLGNPSDWYTKVMEFKGNRPEYVVVLSLIGIEEPNNCEVTIPAGEANLNNPQGAEVGARLAEFTKMFGKQGVIGDVCAPAYDPFLESAVSVIEFACDSIPPGF